MAEEKSENKEENQERHKKTPVWEWIVAAVGLILVVGSLGLTLYRAVIEESTPPILAISVEEIVPTPNGYLVKFRVKNTGNQTAAALTIEGELKRGAESVETSTASLAYAPANSEREGGLFFTKNPNEFELNIRALGYEKP
ncbi:MAG: TIGR02588 family protein [Pyrinomonadaceae bacterium]